MIENKELGLKIAENPEEKAWYGFVYNTEQVIKQLKERIKKAEENLKLSAREIEQKFKKGARMSIKSDKETIILQKELLKFGRSKL